MMPQPFLLPVFFMYLPLSLSLCSQYIAQQVSKLHVELEEKQSFNSILQVVEEEEEKRRAQNMQRFITASFGNSTTLIVTRKVRIED